ncbi:hypothetical protein [uncultured Roseovarius sp.]|uniref:hypothetical protein n=1 Tax=uncultured Roseovarius sp. TaxID=293344 RepID=UPI002629C9C7|nr:hypothetical protein [uncultured Roseovarius sp.]
MVTPVDYTTAPTNFENIPEQEGDWRTEITAMMVQLQERRKAVQNSEILRGVHPKSHGCLDAEFSVNTCLDSRFKIGLFAEPGRSFKAKIRYSNADVLKRADLEVDEDESGNKVFKHGSRGMAIKVLDVDGPVYMEDGGAKNQDFLMINTPEFAFRNVRDYRRLTQVLLASADAADPELFFLPLKLLELGVLDPSGNLLPPQPSEPEIVKKLRLLFTSSDLFKDFSADDMRGALSSFAIVQKIQAKAVRDPIDARYFSAAPFRFGPDRVMRVSVEPVGGEQPVPPFSDAELAALDADYLSKALADRMACTEAIKLSFKIQIADAAQLEGKIDDMIENAAMAWDENDHPFTEVAQLTIHPPEQDVELVDRCKPLLFTPWHALNAHEPLGGINRLRKPVYSTSATFRRTT